MGLQHAAALGLLLAGNPPALLVTQLETGARGQPLDGLREGQAVDFLHELDDVAALGAGEAVPQPAGRGHVERRGLLVVERAQPLQRAAAGAAELEVLAHHLVDGGPLANELDVLVADPPCHLRPPRFACCCCWREFSPRCRHCAGPTRGPHAEIPRAGPADTVTACAACSFSGISTTPWSTPAAWAASCTRGCSPRGTAARCRSPAAWPGGPTGPSPGRCWRWPGWTGTTGRTGLTRSCSCSRPR